MPFEETLFYCQGKRVPPQQCEIKKIPSQAVFSAPSVFCISGSSKRTIGASNPIRFREKIGLAHVCVCVVEREQRKTRPRHSSLGSQRKDEEMRPISPSSCSPSLLSPPCPQARWCGGGWEENILLQSAAHLPLR